MGLERSFAFFPKSLSLLIQLEFHQLHTFGYCVYFTHCNHQTSESKSKQSSPCSLSQTETGVCMVLVYRDNISKRHSLPANDKTGQEQIPGTAWSLSGLSLSPRTKVVGPAGLYIQQQSSHSPGPSFYYILKSLPHLVFL